MKHQKMKERIFNLLVSLLIAVVFIFAIQIKPQAKLQNEEEIIAKLQEVNEENPESIQYLVTDENISNVLPETDIETFKENIEEGITIYEDGTEVTSGIIKTGMKLKYLQNNRSFDISVLGDLNEDGILNQIELTREIRNIVDSDGWSLEDELEILSGDIDKNKTIDTDDIERIIDYIVYKKLDTVSYPIVAKPVISLISGELKKDRYISDVEINISRKR